MDERRILMGRYEIGRQLGQGSFAKVYYARNIRTNLGVAIKMIDKEKVLQSKLIEQIKREITVMRLARHPNIIQLYEVMASRTKIYFILEYAKGGELFNKVAKGKLKEEVARRYFQQLITAVDYCHSRGVYHRDLKPENLLMDENEKLKVSDFGLSALQQSRREDGMLHTTCGTPAYVAPEVLSRKGYDGAKADIWSCGVILFVLAAGYLPFHDRNLVEMYRKIAKAEYKCPRWFSQELRDLLYKILDPDPLNRLTIAKIKRTIWYRRPIDEGSPRDGTKDRIEIAGNDTEASTSQDFTLADIHGKARSLPHLTAFDIISLSTGFDLSGLFEVVRKEAKFTSKQPATTIIEKLFDVAHKLKLGVTKNDSGSMRLVTPKGGRKGAVEIDAEVYEVAPSLHLVEMRKIHGDSFEYHKLMKHDLAPALKDIVWVWDGSLQKIQEELIQREQNQIAQTLEGQLQLVDQQVRVRPEQAELQTQAPQIQIRQEEVEHHNRQRETPQEQIQHHNNHQLNERGTMEQKQIEQKDQLLPVVQDKDPSTSIQLNQNEEQITLQEQDQKQEETFQMPVQQEQIKQIQPLPEQILQAQVMSLQSDQLTENLQNELHEHNELHSLQKNVLFNGDQQQNLQEQNGKMHHHS